MNTTLLKMRNHFKGFVEPKTAHASWKTENTRKKFAATTKLKIAISKARKRRGMGEYFDDDE